MRRDGDTFGFAVIVVLAVVFVAAGTLATIVAGGR